MMAGVAVVALNPFGPVQEYAEAPVVLALKLTVPPAQIAEGEAVTLLIVGVVQAGAAAKGKPEYRPLP